MNNSNWHIEDFDLKLVKQIAEEFSLPQSIAKIMSLRGIIDRDRSIHISNVILLHNGEPTKIGRREGENGKLVRFAKKTGEEIN